VFLYDNPDQLAVIPLDVDGLSIAPGSRASRVILTSSKKDQNCATLKIDEGRMPEVQAWTNLFNPDTAQGRQGELEVTMPAIDTVEVCFRGDTELSDDDDATVVLVVTGSDKDWREADLVIND
jgi:hypothetical protein